MKRTRKRLLSVIISLLLLCTNLIPVYAEGDNQSQPAIDVSAPSAVLIEASTGQVIYAKDENARRSPASITKIMTMLIAFDALTQGKIQLTDEVVTSAYAQSMGGSQVFLEEGEVQTVDTLLKCIAVASGNDASVALAEYIAGSEAEFVNMMNKRAVGLGMNDTHFEDCCGLTTSTNHYSTARDIAVMSKELITKYPNVYHYTTIWMEDITHTTSRGSTPFTLSSTNKLLKQYQWATGLKTGSTSLAKYCLAATATKDGIDLIAVVLAAPDHKVRFNDAATLLNYGFSVSRVYVDENLDEIPLQDIRGGVQDHVKIIYAEPFRYLDLTGMNKQDLKKELQLTGDITAPVTQGALAGKAVYKINDKEIGSVNLLYGEAVAKAGYKDYVKKVMSKYLL